MRWKITIEYDGSDFSGWQRQENAGSVQEKLEGAARAFIGSPTVIHGAGRTDAGVHAAAQTAHFDLPAELDGKFSASNIVGAFNHHLNCPAIAVLAAEQVADDFDARHSAVKRIYRYHIVMRTSPIALLRDRAWQVAAPLDIAACHAAAEKFIGRHDFTSFRATACQAKDPVKTLDALQVERQGENLFITAAARSFLHHQVRNMVGAIVACGKGSLAADDITRLLQARDRSLAPPTAPAHGLCLMQVQYE